MSAFTAHLDHLCIESANPQALAAFYGQAMQMQVLPQADDSYACEGRERRMVFCSGTAKALRYFAWNLPSPEALEATRNNVVAAGLDIAASPSPFFDDTAFAVRDPDGNLLVLGHDPADRTTRKGLPARLQHHAFGTTHIQPMLDFYTGVLGMTVSDNVYADDGSLRSSFLRAGTEHHILAIFVAPQCSFDHHCYEAGEWNLIRDWADLLSEQDILLDWGPGRHGPGNNLFFMIRDPDTNWLEISAELELCDASRPTGSWQHREKTLNSWGKAYLRS
ncbi:VOC family protein [Pusillimonas minor]|uniref:VOC family protein n=1 Tax=Pusillimonas minor TaxID=2697024 RepID=A0A842HPU2_9BURK|nr:VOC family protein [Pusillimonas minor]MBC2769874.1 VOC family protein [Pusillimonas minor]